MPAACFNASEFLAHCTSLPGVYRMQDAAGQLLYVGKANNLKKRLASYFRSSGLSPKTKALVSQIALIETTITSNETEALLLEQNLIKQWHPPYNILLRDDKSYPYLYLSDGIYPGLYLHRGSKKKLGRYFGPYPNSSAVRDSLKLLQKTFRVRQCEDTQFHNRSRPCLQHQIQRCKAPCVGLVSAPEYAQDVHHSVLFLEGHNNRLTDELSQQMEQQAQQLNFEKAAEIRDQIGQLRHLQNRQGMESRSENADILAIALESGLACINLVYIRGGRMLGDRNIFIQPQMDETAPEVLQAFLEQHYLNQTEFELPNELVVPPQTLEDPSPLLAAIKNTRGKSLRLSSQVRGIRNHWLQQAHTNATQSLHTKLRSQQQLEARFTALTQALQLPKPAQRLECFDISHHQGEATVAACVAFSPSGPIKSDYRCYNIENVTSGDDYAAMQAALIKRFSKAEQRLPDLLLIDGGKGQLNAVKETLGQLNLTHLKLLGIAKGVTRKPGLETLYLDDIQNEFTLPSDDPALHLIQQVRDEAHRFAITGNRTRLNKKRKGSTLEQIPAVGPKRRQALLKHFGGLQALKNASISEIARVPGVSSNLANTIYAALHTE